MSKYIIYGLVDPNTNQIRYIGKSTYGIRRPKEHLKPSNYLKQKNHKANWIKSLMEKGLKPTIVILKEAATPEELFQMEIDTIKEYREKYNNLTNLTDGGEGSLGWVPTKEQKENMSSSRNKYLSTLTEPLKAVNKKEHVFIDNVECKICVTCKTAKPLIVYSNNKNTWDSLHTKCKPCAAEYTRKFRENNPTPTLTKEELVTSYKNRAERISKGIRRKLEEDPNYRDNRGVKNKKAIEGTNVITGEKIIFNSGVEAKEQGFQNTNLGQAIRNNVPYKGYIWKFICR